VAPGRGRPALKVAGQRAGPGRRGNERLFFFFYFFFFCFFFFYFADKSRARGRVWAIGAQATRSRTRRGPESAGKSWAAGAWAFFREIRPATDSANDAIRFHQRKGVSTVLTPPFGALPFDSEGPPFQTD